jgi:hypothetical protein
VVATLGTIVDGLFPTAPRPVGTPPVSRIEST